MSRLGIIVAQYEEFYPLKERLQSLEGDDIPYLANYEDIIISVSGVGKLNAMNTSYDLILNHGVDCILNIGVSAGRGNLNIGDIVFVDRVYDGDFDISIFNHPKYYVPEIGDCIGVPMNGRDVRTLSLPCFTISQFLEGDIDTEIEDYVVDMEYYSIAYTGLKFNIPTYAIKCISDTSKTESLIEYEANLSPCSELLASYVVDYLKSPRSTLVYFNLLS